MSASKVNMDLQISRLLEYGVRRGLIKEEDATYSANRMLALLREGSFTPAAVREKLRTPEQALDELCELAAEKGLVEPDTRDGRDQFDTELMACLTPRPSEVVGRFRTLYDQSPKEATDYYYDLSRATNYIRVDRVEKDRLWTAPTPYGDLVITINLSKPEKDPKAIAAAKNAPKSGYPACALCRENEGYLGSANQAPRGNHRLIPIELCGEKWFLQYSPYVYYNEHCIVLSEEHRPMKVSADSFKRLLEFVTVLPHYFLGSNADLPIVGGSILTHDHFQGGNFEFPMAKAGLREDILAYSGSTPHNTITPIARRRGEDYELDLVLRNNRTTQEHPLGIFHPHGEYHHIKKENIGLIEVMGLAILPPRLLTETEELARALAEPESAGEIMARPEMEKHLDWYKELKEKNIPKENIQREIQVSIGQIFGEILGNAGVFKDDEAGKSAFRRFCGLIVANGSC